MVANKHGDRFQWTTFPSSVATRLKDVAAVREQVGPRWNRIHGHLEWAMVRRNKDGSFTLESSLVSDLNN
jgi:hypothetical protein